MLQLFAGSVFDIWITFCEAVNLFDDLFVIDVVAVVGDARQICLFDNVRRFFGDVVHDRQLFLEFVVLTQPDVVL